MFKLFSQLVTLYEKHLLIEHLLTFSVELRYCINDKSVEESAKSEIEQCLKNESMCNILFDNLHQQPAFKTYNLVNQTSIML